MTVVRPQYQPVGRCIYCGSKIKLSKEHIIPLALGGLDVLPQSSCIPCNAKTSRLEQDLTQRMWGQWRAALNMPSRNHVWKPETPEEVAVFRNGVRRVEIVPTKDLPALLVMPVLPMPAIVTGKQVISCPTKSFSINDHQLKEWEDQHVYAGAFNLQVFSRSLAKIAHAYLSAEIGIDAFEPVLPPAILGDIDALHFVGSPPENAAQLPIEEGVGHVMTVVDLNGPVPYVGVLMRLFSNFGTPQFLVVCGHRK